MEEDRKIYIITTGTCCKMGKFIRIMTGYAYNHVSVALDERPKVLYSFARHYKDTPFYAGFVRESALRYVDGGVAMARVYAVPVTAEQYSSAQRYLESVSENAGSYLYNMASAACVPLHKKVNIDRAYTCVEFAIAFLDSCGALEELKSGRFYSIRELNRMLSPYLLYDAPITQFMSESDWEGDTFPDRQPLLTRIELTARSNGRLFAALLRERAER